MQSFIYLALVLSLYLVRLASGECPGIIGVLGSHTVNNTHQEVMLCWTFENALYISNYDIEILCKHQGVALTPKVKLKLDGYRTTAHVANVTLQCGSYCNVSVSVLHYDGGKTKLHGSIDTFVTLTPVIEKATLSTSNMASLLIKSSTDLPMSCGDIQSFNITLHRPGASLVRHRLRSRNWARNNDGGILLTLANISYCDPPASVSIQRSNAVAIGHQPLEAPVINCVLLQDSALTLVFSDTALCSNSSWEVCVTSDSQHQTEHCSIHSAGDRLITVDAGTGSVYSVRSRTHFGDWQSPYSDTTTLGATSVLPRDQLTMRNIGLPDVRLCYVVNLPILSKATSLPKPKQFAAHYKLCGSMDERISNLSVTESCLDLQGWPGGHCYEVQLFLTLDIDGLEISLNTTIVQQGPILPLIALAAIPVLVIIVGCLLYIVWARQNRVRNHEKAAHYPFSKITVSGMSVWIDSWSQTSIEPDTQSEYITLTSEFGSNNNDYPDKVGSYLGDTKSDDSQVIDSEYVYVRSTLSPSRNACTSTSICTSSSTGMSGQTENIRLYNKEPSLVNFSCGE